MATVKEIISYINGIAPPALAESWDPIGLQVGDPQAAVTDVLLCLDLTSSALARARAVNAQLVITHHPLLFSPLAAICHDQPQQKLIMDLIRHEIAVFSAHTNLDAAAGGVADALAGRIDNVECNWQPVVRIESPELKMDGIGHGRFCDLNDPIPLSELRQIVWRKLSGTGVRVNTDQDPIVSRLAVFPGSFDESWLERLLELDIDTIITGECKHHISLLLAAHGISMLEAGHDVTERVVLEPLRKQLAAAFSQIGFAVYEGLDYNKVAF